MYLLFVFIIPLLGVIGNVFFSRLILLLHSFFGTCIFYLMVVNMCDRNM